MGKKKPKKWVACPVEAEYFGNDRKEARLDRKMASQRDRSKFKKSDRRQKEKQKKEEPQKEGLLRGRVLSITSEGIVVDHQNKQFICVLRGTLKQRVGLKKNLVIVGDFVFFEPVGESEGAVVHIEERRSVLSRADNLHRRKEQLIAANVDQVIITTSVVSPPLKPFLIDRYLIAAKKGNMKPLVVVNKCDLLEQASEEEELYRQFVHSYKQAGFILLPVSVKKNQGLEELKEFMKDCVSVFSGQSGVGKSSLINALLGTELSVGEVVEKTKKGSHTTSTAQLLELSFGGWVIDTPGIKSFGVWDVEEADLDSYFPDIVRFSSLCRYKNCSHIKEEGCAVQDAVVSGEIPEMRYHSYRCLLESIREEHRPR